MIVVLACMLSELTSAQVANVALEKYTAHNKGKFFILWGGNREKYSKSDITFQGADHDFTLQNVEAHCGLKSTILNPVNHSLLHKQK